MRTLAASHVLWQFLSWKRGIYFILFLCVWQCDKLHFACADADPIDAQFDRIYTGNSSANHPILVYRYNISNVSEVVRIWLESVEANQTFPLLVVVREQRAILSWSVPLMLDNGFMYNEVARTLCPVNSSALPGDNYYSDPGVGAVANNIQVEISTYSFTPVHFAVLASRLPEFILTLEQARTIHVTPSTPQYFKFTIDPHSDVETVIVRVSSPDRFCMIVSIQPINCPVFDLDTNVDYTGMHQTIISEGAITVQRNYLPKFYVVFVVKPNDYVCSGIEQVLDPQSAATGYSRNKTVTVTVMKSIDQMQYVMATLTVVACFFGVYLFVAGLSLVFHVVESKDLRLGEERQAVLASINGNGDICATYGSMDSGVSNTACVSANPLPDGDVDADAETEDYDKLDDAVQDKDVLRSKLKLYVADLAKKPYKSLAKKYKLYHWNLITIAIFYILPVIQLVLTYQSVVVLTGNQDICYYNFLCSKPLWGLLAFNNVFSNVGYVMLGILFLILVKKRDADHKKAIEENELLITQYGIPRHFGLFYAMGVALVMEGVLSACYHICPSYSNFQFDTAFMYMIGCLGMLKVYQIRHPDINAHAHVAYCVMALVILLAVVGVVYGGTPFWIIFGISYIALLFSLSAEFYYKGRFKIDISMFYRLKQEWHAHKHYGHWCRPTYPQRMIFCLFGISINLAFIIWGLVTRPKDFASYLLSIFISNLLLYMLFYISMKIACRERIGWSSIVYIILSIFTWSCSLFFFFAELTTWQKTPAESREHNKNCIFLDFYDAHDVWHFLSSISLFLSFMIVLTIDDDLVYTSQQKIVVF